MAKDGFFHSAIPSPSSFVAGVSSVEEIATVKRVLHPAESKIIKGHLVDVVDAENCDGSGGQILQMVVQTPGGERRFTRTIEPGTFLINCTDHITDARHESVLSEGGRVCSPQWVCGFPGPTANYVTHLFYQGNVDQVWPKIPRLDMDLENKVRAFHIFSQLLAHRIHSHRCTK
jgi:hypothetical protein